jgi:hypothetical protein
MDQAYEAVGLRDNGDVYAIEVLGQQTQSFAAARYYLDCRTLRRQPRHYPIFISLSVSSRVRLPASPKVPILSGRQTPVTRGSHHG